MTGKKILKVVWICHFTNFEIQSLLPLWKNIDEFASWTPNTLKGFENRDDIEIHVICPHEYLKKSTQLLIHGIHYYFLPYGIPVWHRHWPALFRFDLFTDFWSFRKKARKIISGINPHLINLIGAENAYYSSVVLDLYKTIPTLVTIEGFVSEFKDLPNLSTELKKRIQVEEQILSNLTHFSGDADIPRYISKYNQSFQYYPLENPANEELAASNSLQGELEKKYDCIYFGRLVKEKGIFDFVQIIAEIKKTIPGIKACIAGGGDIHPLVTFARELKCEENIDFIGFIKTQKELFNYVKSSRVFIAPPLIDRLSSTIREAMLLKIPVVAYATGAIPSINATEENIFLVDTGDYIAMAKKTLALLQDKDLRDQLVRKAYEFYQKNFSLKVNVNLFLSAYQNVLQSK